MRSSSRALGASWTLARNAGEYAAKTVANFRPVSTAELNQPDDGDWLNWRRTLDGHGHSPLTAINTSTVSRLGLQWSMAMHTGSNQPTPLVRDGVMFLTHPNNKIQAIRGGLWGADLGISIRLPARIKNARRDQPATLLCGMTSISGHLRRCARGGRRGNRAAALAHPESRLS